MIDQQKLANTLPDSLDGDWSGLVIYVGDTAWDGNQFVSQHVAKRLARRAPVLYVDPPLSRVSALRRPALRDSLREPRIRMLQPGLARLTPVVLPALSKPVMREVTTALLCRAIRRATGRLGVRPRAIVANSVLPVLDSIDADRRVFYATDDFVGGAALTGLDARWVERQMTRQIGAADIVLTASQVLDDKCQADGVPSRFVPNGCDTSTFAGVDTAPMPTDVTLHSPIAGFVGHLSSRIDIGYLEALADHGVSVLLVGPRQLTFQKARIDPLFDRPNVQWVGAKPFTELPSYMRVIDVGLVPYADTAFNRASFPLKILEYLAAGREVVSTDLPAARWLATDLVKTSTSPDEFAELVARSLADGISPEQLSACRRFAEQHSWDRRVDQIAEAIGLTN